MSAIYFAEGVHAVRVGRDLVILDVPRDRYLSLPGGGEAVAPGEAGQAACRDAAVLADLRAAGLVADRPSADLRPPFPPAGRRSALRDRYPPPRLADAAPAARAAVGLAWGHARRPLGEILAAARHDRTTPPAVTPALIDAVDRFHRWAPFAPIPGKCLIRSHVLLRELRRQGLDAVWVFGVRIWPFHAHCWLQAEDLVLDDHADRILAYTPILAV